MSRSIETVIQSKYGEVATSGLSTQDVGVRSVAEAFGYSPGELEAIPADANMGLSCGNPTASASLRPGEVVVDLGCGGGIDVFLAALKVGPEGKAIGIDITAEMIALAKRNAAKGIKGKPFTNVEFLVGHIDQLPLPGGCADCVVSNCVINLATDKRAVFREIFRVLKPGGRVAVSDIALKKTLPAELAESLFAYVGCVSGAILIDDYRRGLIEAGFLGVHVVDAGSDLNAYASVEGQSACCSPTMTSSTGLPVADPGRGIHGGLAEILRQYNINEYAASVRVFGVKAK